MDTSFFGARLKELRKTGGMTQPELAEKAGMSKGGIADLEQGINQPSWATVASLAKALGVDCRAFLQPPADSEPQGRGRPSKAEAESVVVGKPASANRKGKK